MDKSRPKTSRLKRKTADPIQLTDRDADILRALHTYRFLTTDHLQTLTGTESRWGMNKRLRLLYDHKYIDRPKAQAAIFSHADKRPTVYALGNAGAKLLSERYGAAMPPSVYWTEKNRRVRERHIEHTLGISDFMVEIETLCKTAPELHLISQEDILAQSPAETRRAKYPFRWNTQVNHNGQRHDIMILPDYVFGLRTRDGRERFFFVEIDRGTMPVTRRDITQTSFVRKILSYADTFERGLALRRFGMAGFQVLTVTTSQARIQTIQDAIANLSDTSFSANTFLFKSKSDSQAPFPFHAGWQNIKGAGADII
jgi:hypothetical protein